MTMADPRLTEMLDRACVAGRIEQPFAAVLDNDEVATADAVMTFPVNPAYASLNLAQAVLLVGYEFMRAANGDTAPFACTERSPAAPREMVLSFFDYLEGELERNGFFRPLGKQPVMRRNLRNMFHRMRLTEQDVRTLRGMIVRLVQGPRADAEGHDSAVPAPVPHGPDSGET